MGFSAKQNATSSSSAPATIALSAIRAQSAPTTATGITELDRVLGGGIVPGSVILLGGDPGIGKSTLLLQAGAALATDGVRCLYLSGEESLQQVALRAQRLNVIDTPLDLLSETQLEAALTGIATLQPQVVIIDSIQTLNSAELQSSAGSVGQVRHCAGELVRYAKQHNTAILIIGHVTKEGAIAGPRVLEHMVDTVLYFDSDRSDRYRLVRAIKNRFGAVNELGIFAMTDGGLKQVRNPSAIFLSGRDPEVAGSVVTVMHDSNRPLLLEIQALVDTAAGAAARRVAVGLDSTRIAMLLAILHRHAGVSMLDQDVYVNVVGGIKIAETAVDLAVILATLSSFNNLRIPVNYIILGELGLSGEVRPVPNGEARLREASKHGFTHAIVPVDNQPKNPLAGIEILGVRRLPDALQIFD